MRILLVSPAAQLGGAERCLVDCAVALGSAARVDVEVLSLADGPLLDQLGALGISTTVIKAPNQVAELGEVAGPAVALRAALAVPAGVRFLARLRRAVVDARPDVVHTNGMKAHLLAGAVLPPGARLVVHLHDFIGSRAASRRLLPALARLRSQTVFVANSNAVARDFAQLAPNVDVRTVYNVVDTNYFSPGAGEPSWLASEAALAPDERAISFGLVATFARWKGHKLFIEAAGRLRSAHPNVPLRFYIVGGPIYATSGSQISATNLFEWARTAGISDCFGLVPFQQDIARVYRSLNVVVHASTEPEPFGRTIVEAMACERPVLVSNAGGAAELFQHGKNAWGFVPRNVDALAEAMSVMVDETTRKWLGRCAREHATAFFGRDRLQGELLRSYQAHGG